MSTLFGPVRRRCSAFVAPLSRRPLLLRSTGAALLSVLAVACASTVEDAAAPAASEVRDGGGAQTEPACVIGAIRCRATLVSRCEADEGGPVAWSTPSSCPGDEGCRSERCEPPTARQRTQAAAVAGLIAELSAKSAWHEDVDASAVTARERAAILKGDGEDATYFGSAWRVMNAFPQGHQGLYSAACDAAMPQQNTSRFGVCGRPAADGVVVTLASAQNKLGLRAGDIVLQAGADAGDAMLEAAYMRPVCGSVFPSKSGRQTAGAASFFAHVPPGAVLKVRDSGGAVRDVTVPKESDAKVIDCTDPFSRSRRIYAEATKRPDGVAVIRLPSFFPYDKMLGANATDADVQAMLDAYRAKVALVFDTVKDAPAIVWDARGNTGGFTPVALAIVSGFASARIADLSYCRSREFGSSPIAYGVDTYAAYTVEPGGPFAYTGKVAVVTDGLAYSAGDYFPFAAARGSSAVVVGMSAGAFGGGNGPIELAGPPTLFANYDPTACFDALTGAPLEGSPLPSTPIEYVPTDLAAGKDTPIERAVLALGL